MKPAANRPELPPPPVPTPAVLSPVAVTELRCSGVRFPPKTTVECGRIRCTVVCHSPVVSAAATALDNPPRKTCTRFSAVSAARCGGVLHVGVDRQLRRCGVSLMCVWGFPALCVVAFAS